MLSGCATSIVNIYATWCDAMFECILMGVCAVGAVICVFAPLIAPVLPHNEEEIDEQITH